MISFVTIGVANVRPVMLQGAHWKHREWDAWFKYLRQGALGMVGVSQGHRYGAQINGIMALQFDICFEKTDGPQAVTVVETALQSLSSHWGARLQHQKGTAELTWLLGGIAQAFQEKDPEPRLLGCEYPSEFYYLSRKWRSDPHSFSRHLTSQLAAHLTKARIKAIKEEIG